MNIADGGVAKAGAYIVLSLSESFFRLIDFGGFSSAPQDGRAEIIDGHGISSILDFACCFYSGIRIDIGDQFRRYVWKHFSEE